MMAIFIDQTHTAVASESRVMTGAEFKSEFPLDLATATDVDAAIGAGAQVLVSREIDFGQVRGSFPPTAFIQDADGEVYLLYRPTVNWKWMFSPEDRFDGTNGTGQLNARQSYFSAGLLVAVLVGAPDPVNATTKFAIV